MRLRLANLAARSTNNKQKEEAFRDTVSALLALPALEDPDCDIAAHTFYKLGFFQAGEALRELKKSWEFRPPVGVRIDIAGKRIENAIDEHLDTVLTDFQKEFYRAILSIREGSVSAPTSAGKSFAMARALHAILQKQPTTVIYLVPTRALIREVAGRLRSLFLDHKMAVPVRTTPVVVPTTGVGQGVVYVLTQERLISLLNEAGPGLKIDLVLVDEAQEIEADERGILLDTAIAAARRQSPSLRIFYASPTISNPEHLLSRQDGRSYLENRSPVAHYYWKVRYGSKKANQKYDHWFDISDRKDEVRLRVPLLRKPKKEKYGQRAAAALNFHHPGTTTVVFCDGPDQAEKTAAEIARALPDRKIPDDVAALIAHIRKEVHQHHPLADWLAKGVAVHFRPLPSLVRTQVEQLCNNSHLEFVCCTTTLLKGINLPCRNIILINPAPKGNTLKSMDVRNLSGRAGRLDRDIRGHVWLVDPDNWGRMEDGQFSYENLEPRPIQRALIRELEAGAPQLKDLNDQEIVSKPLAQTLLGAVVSMREQAQSLPSFAKNPTAANALQDLETRVDRLRDDLRVNRSIIARYPGTDPRRIDALFQHLIKMRDEEPRKFRNMFPVPDRIADEEPSPDGEAKSNTRLWDFLLYTLKPLKAILAKQEETHPQLIRRVTITRRWLLSHRLRSIIEGRCKRDAKAKRKDPDDQGIVCTATRTTIKFIEDDIRFEMSRQFRILQDLMRSASTGTEFEVLSSQMVPFYLFLEFGTMKSDRLGLMGLGFSRATADALAIAFKLRAWEISDPENVVQRLRGLTPDEIRLLKLPVECWVEVASLVGRDPKEIIWQSPASSS